MHFHFHFHSPLHLLIPLHHCHLLRYRRHHHYCRYHCHYHRHRYHHFCPGSSQDQFHNNLPLLPLGFLHQHLHIARQCNCFCHMFHLCLHHHELLPHHPLLRCCVSPRYRHLLGLVPPLLPHRLQTRCY